KVGGDMAHHLGDQLILDFPDHREQHFFPALEIVVEGSPRHAGGGHQIVDAAGLQALLGNEGDGRIDDGGAGALPLARQRGGGGLHDGLSLASLDSAAGSVLLLTLLSILTASSYMTIMSALTPAAPRSHPPRFRIRYQDVTMHPSTNRNSRILLLAISLALAACGGEPQQQEQGVPTVGVITAVPELVVVTTEMSGRLEPWRIAEVRAQVSGIVESRDFAEGSDVKAGQKLFQIDPAPYQASVNEAESNLAVARANLLKAKAQYDRIAALGKVKAVSELDEITAQATFRQAEAGVAAAQAAVESARIDLAHATVRAPIDGRAGRSLVTEGALVRQEDATHLTTIQQIQPIYAS